MGLTVVFRKILAPGAIFVVVPVVIILVVSIVDADLNAGLLGCGSGHDGYWGGEGRGEE
jgi:hypothetical protein